MPTDLPRPRDRAEREKMIAAWVEGRRRLACGTFGSCSAHGLDTFRAEAIAAIPSPVSEASPEGMPEYHLQNPWQVFDTRDGATSWSFGTKEEAVKWVASHGNRHHAVGKIRYSEVVEPEPETAPSGWRYEVKEERPTGRRYLWIGDAKGRLISTAADIANVPPIDREHVARLLEARRDQ